jgi:hypothetical protein
MNIIVKTDNRKNYTGTFPGVGKVVINHEGEFESDSDSFDELQSHFSEFYDKEKGKPIIENIKVNNEQKKSETQDLTGEFDEEELKELEELRLQQEEKNKLKNNQQNTLSEEEVKEYVESLSIKTRKELEEMCTSFPSKEWRGKNKEDLINFLTDKLA